LCSQFAQRHFGTLHGFALGAESGIAQAWPTVFANITAFTAWTAVTKTVTASITRATWTTVPTGTRAALTGSAITAAISTCSSFCFLLTRTVITTHRHNRLGGFGRGYRGRRRFGRGGISAFSAGFSGID
jgi:hypothetical protein